MAIKKNEYLYVTNKLVCSFDCWPKTRDKAILELQIIEDSLRFM